MTSLRDEIVAHIDALLDGVERHPRMYGSRLETVELTTLRLLELRDLTLRPAWHRSHPRFVLDAWRRHLRVGFPEVGNRLLWVLLEGSADGDGFGVLVRELGALRRQLAAEVRPDNSYAVHDLALALRMKRDRALPTAERIGDYYGLVGRVLRSVMRRGSARGRLRPELEDAIALRPAGGIETNPQNGLGAEVLIPLAWPSPSTVRSERTAQAEDEARATFRQFVDLAAWAADESASVAMAERLVPDPSLRVGIAGEVLRLSPAAASDIEAVEIGGASVGRQFPVRVTASARARLVELIETSIAGSTFDELGTLRMIDLDDGRLRLRSARGGERTSAIDVLLQDADQSVAVAALLGREVRVRGERFEPADGGAFVLADMVEAVAEGDDGVGETASAA